MIILIILCWIAVALIYLLQFQIVRDYKPFIGYGVKDQVFRYPKTAQVYSLINNADIVIIKGVELVKESIFKWKRA